MADFLPSGFGPADQLQMILARKQAEKHQALMESLAQQEASTRKQQADSLEAERLANAKRYEAAANRDRLGDYVAGQDLSPEDVSWMDEAGFGGLKQTTVTPEVPGEVGPGIPLNTSVTYKGSPKEQAEQKATSSLLALQQNPEFLKADPLSQALMLRQAGITNPEPFLRHQTDDDGLWVFDESTGKTTKQEGPTAKSRVVTRSRPPQPRAEPSHQPVPSYGKDGQVEAWWKWDEPTDTWKQVMGPGPTQPKAATTKEAPTFDESQMAQLQRAKLARATANRSGQTVTPEQQKALDSAEQVALMQVMSSYRGKGIPPNWQRNFLNMKAAGYGKMKLPDVIKQLESVAENGKLTPEEVQLIQDIFPLIQDH